MHIQGSWFTIRLITPSEEGEILDIYRQCEDFLALGPVAQASMQMVMADLALSKRQGGVFCGIYGAENQIIGIIDYVPKGWQGDEGCAELSLLMIAAPFRRMGLGAEVVRCFEEFVFTNPKITRIESGVQVNNPGAIRFWTRMGYQIVSEARSMDDGTTCYQLEKMRPQVTNPTLR